MSKIHKVAPCCECGSFSVSKRCLHISAVPSPSPEVTSNIVWYCSSYIEGECSASLYSVDHASFVPEAGRPANFWKQTQGKYVKFTED